MRILLVAIVLAAAAGGCSHRQRVEASGVAERAKRDSQRAARDARQSLSSAALTARVKTAMTASVNLDTSNLNVDTVNGVVHLRGSVPTLEQKALAARIARDTAGPNVHVEDELRVGSRSPRPPPLHGPPGKVRSP